MLQWVREWSPVLAVLIALGGFHGFIRADTHRMEDRLVARIGELNESVDELKESVGENTTAIVDNGKAIARLEGLVRGLHGLDLMEEDR